LNDQARQALAHRERVKREIRERVWALLDREGAVRPPGAQGRIPNFAGAEDAAERLAILPAWQMAAVVKANPDKAQLAVRARALLDGKLVYMAVPRLADTHPFFLLDPNDLAASPWEAATSRQAAATARKVAVAEVRPVDLVVCGSVAVNRSGARLGKGGGFSDIEVALLHEAGLIGPQTTLVTTVHALQVIEEPIPETDHDFRVDLIVTPNEVIDCQAPRRPPRILWDHLDEDKIAAIPVLATHRPRD
jgi:5-formyltetrahydrofolate cyclo-ligase